MAPQGSRTFLQRWQSSRSFTALSALVWTLLACSLLAAPLPINNTKPDSYPAWWFEREVIKQTTEPPVAEPVWPGNYPAADDYTAVNLGQLKHVATQAAAEMSAHLPGGTSPAIDALVAQWAAPPANGVTRDDFTALNLGQLKAVAKLFYDRLIAVRYIRAYPWAAGNADDFTVANLGQLKYLFSFDLTYSTMHDGVPDWWKLAAGLKVTAPVLTIFTGNNTLLINGQPITYAIAYSQGYDPTTAATSDPENNPVPGQGSPLTELGTVNYVAIDVSSAHTQEDVSSVAIDDAGKIGFLYSESDACKSAIFANGAVTAGQNLTSFYYDGLLDIYTGLEPPYRVDRSATSVNASGDIGSVLCYVHIDLGRIGINGSEFSPPASAIPGFGTGMFIPDMVTGQVNIGNSGLAMGMCSSSPIAYFPGIQYAFMINTGACTWYDPTTISFEPYLFSPSGLGVGGYGQSGSGEDIYAVGDYSSAYSIGRLSPLAISDDYLVVGDDESAEDDKDALSVHDGHVPRRLSSLLPDEYCNKIRFPRHKDDFFPKAWINTDGYIVVTAEVLDDRNPGAPKWVPRTLLWRNALNADDDEINPKTLSFAVFPADASRQQFNAAATFVGIQWVAKKDANGDPTTDGAGHQAAALLLPLKVDYLARQTLDDGTPIIESLDGEIYESDPIPTVTLTAQSVSLDSTSHDLTIHVNCEIRDYATDVGTGSLNELKFLIDGELAEAVPDLTSYQIDDAVTIWRPYGVRANLQRTFTIPAVKAGAHTVVAITGENAAGRQGWDSVNVTVGWDADQNLAVVDWGSHPLHNSPPTMCPVVCRWQVPSSIADWLTGDNAPELRLGGNTVYLTQSENVGVADGETLPPGEKWLYVTDPQNPFGDSDDPRLYFFAEGFSDFAYLDGSDNWKLEMKVGDSWITLDERQLTSLDPATRMGTETSTIARAMAANAVPAQVWGYPEFFLALEVMYGPVERKAAEALSLPPANTLAIIPVTAWFSSGVEVSSPSDPVPYIHVDSGFKTPAAAAAAFHEKFRTLASSQFNYHNLLLEAASLMPDGDMLMAAELERYHSDFSKFAADLVVSATETYIQLLPTPGGWVTISLYEIPNNWKNGNKKAAFIDGGFALLGVLGHGLKAGKSLIIRTAGAEITLEGNTGIAIGEACEAALKEAKSKVLARTLFMRKLKKSIAIGAVPAEKMEELYDLGFFAREDFTHLPPVDVMKAGFEPYDVLGFGILKKAGELPQDAVFDQKTAWRLFSQAFNKCRRHHDLPVAQEFQRMFLRVGMDPNDGELFGRAVKTVLHDSWHTQKWNLVVNGQTKAVNFGKGGPFNAAWRTFVARLQRLQSSGPSGKQIESFLQDIRSGPVEIEVGEDIFSVNFSKLDGAFSPVSVQ